MLLITAPGSKVRQRRTVRRSRSSRGANVGLPSFKAIDRFAFADKRLETLLDSIDGADFGPARERNFGDAASPLRLPLRHTASVESR
jgi:hypothetical protein